MDPLVVEGRVSKKVDPFLVDGQPVALTELLAQPGGKLILVVYC